MTLEVCWDGLWTLSFGPSQISWSRLLACVSSDPWVIFEHSRSDHETRSIRCHARSNPCRLLHPSCIRILRRSLKRGVKWTWTGSAFSTNESAWRGIMVMGSQSRVWSRPKWCQSGYGLKFPLSHWRTCGQWGASLVDLVELAIV